MPEGPEIRRAADRLSHVLCGQSLTGVYFFSEELEKSFDQKGGAAAALDDIIGLGTEL